MVKCLLHKHGDSRLNPSTCVKMPATAVSTSNQGGRDEDPWGVLTGQQSSKPERDPASKYKTASTWSKTLKVGFWPTHTLACSCTHTDTHSCTHTCTHITPKAIAHSPGQREGTCEQETCQPWIFCPFRGEAPWTAP